MRKPHGFVLDFVGIFDKLEKDLAFDSDEVNAIVKDLQLLKILFQHKMEDKVPDWLSLIDDNFSDKDVDNLIDHFRSADRRKAFFKEYKEIEMLYEIISPDAFLRPFLKDYSTLSAIYKVVRKAYTKTVQVDREFQRKTNVLVQEHVGVYDLKSAEQRYRIDGNTIEIVKNAKGGDATKVVNLVKSIERTAEENSDDPVLIAMADRARDVQEQFEDRQETTESLLKALYELLRRDQARRKEQAEKGFDGLTWLGGAADAEEVGLLLDKRSPEFQRGSAPLIGRPLGLRDRPRTSPFLCPESRPELEKSHAGPSRRLGGARE